MNKDNMNKDTFLYYDKQTELLDPLYRYSIVSPKTGYDPKKIEEETKKVLYKFISYISQSIEALKKKEINVLFESLNLGYEAYPDFHIAEKNEFIEVEVISKPFQFCFESDSIIDEEIKIKELKFIQKPSEIIQEQIGNYLFIQIEGNAGSPPERKPYKLEIGPFREVVIYPAWIPENHPEIKWVQKGEEIKLIRNSNGKFNILEEHLDSLNEITQLEDKSILRIIKPTSVPKSKNNTDNGWLYLKEHGCWIGPQNQKLPDNFEKFTPQKENEIVFDLLTKALNTNKSLTFAGEKEGFVAPNERQEKWRLSGKLNNQSMTKLNIPGTPLSFVVKELKLDDNKPDKYWLQLKESDKLNNDDFSERSPLEYFFDNGVEIKFLDENGKEIEGYGKIEVHEIHRKAEEKQVILKNDKGMVLPPANTKRLKLKTNTNALEKQRDALYSLMDSPLPHHHPLIRLLLKRNKFSENKLWEGFSSEQEIEWSVLTDLTRAGTSDQREFVLKAMNTTDFCIMEGPPGSGKTTAILELICQLAKEGKRVLLCASTHVAIDNVLERLVDDDKLLNTILPIRIGDRSRVQENVQKWQLENIKEDKENNGLYQDEALLLEAANLVCGTTLGILQHPLIKNSSKSHPRQPVFDCLIIDECSKTTFAEFLVPALYAKRWVLVGDIRQLSPFVESDWLIANLENLNEKKDAPKMPAQLQEACLTLSILYPYPIPLGSEDSKSNIKDRKKNTFNSYVRLPNKTFEFIKKEIEKRKNEPERDRNGSQLNPVYGFSEDKYLVKCIDNYSNLFDPEAIVFISEDIYKDKFNQLRYDRFVLNDIEWERSQHAFRFRAWYERSKHNDGLDYKFRSRGDEIHEPYKIISILNEELEKTWAGEVAWRLTTLYELRMKEQMAEEYPDRKNLKTQIHRREEELKRLYPAQEGFEWVASGIDNLRSVALPSILSILQEGIPKKWDADEEKWEFKSTLQTGFLDEELDCRFIRLKFQHRMHPDISAFPRKQFYNNDALQDPDDMKKRREWAYNQYPNRAVWKDVNGKAEKNNSNQKEVDALCNELDAFLNWAAHNPKDKNKNPWEVAVITFYKGQERVLRKKLSSLLKYPKEYWGQYFSDHRAKECNVIIKLNTVDRFQGQEADLVLLSMVQTNRNGFLGSPNRLNVALTRARYQLVVLGSKNYFGNQNQSDDLSGLANTLTSI